MKTLKLDGITYDVPFVRDLRESMIRLRDEALKQAEFEYAVSLSHVIALLQHYIANLPPIYE